MKSLLFTYGSLKRGFVRNHHIANQRYLGIASTMPKYAMFQYSSYPAMVDATLAEQSGVVADKAIFGELYEIDSDCLAEVDLVEGCDQGIFVRKPVDLDQITMISLPTDTDVWANIQRKVAAAYFFKKNVLRGAANCGNLWTAR